MKMKMNMSMLKHVSSYAIGVATIALIAGCSTPEERANWGVSLQGKEQVAPSAKAEAEQHAAEAGVKELARAKTFKGTIACEPTAVSCDPQRVTITMHPEGLWRLRAVNLNNEQADPIVAQGCWYQTDTEPNRVVLETQNDTVLSDLTFLSPKKLQVNVFNYVSPKLKTQLSHQAELDRISELKNQTGPTCRP